MKAKQKLEYERPAMQVVELKKQAPLLTTSGERDPYGNPIDWQ